MGNVLVDYLEKDFVGSQDFYSCFRAMLIKANFPEQDADDMFHDFLLKVTEIDDPVDLRSEFNYLGIVSRNFLFNELYKRKNHSRIERRYHEEYGRFLRRSDSNPVDALSKEEGRLAVLAAVSKLPERLRKYIRGRFLDEFSIGELAEKYGDGKKAVCNAIFRGKKELRGYLGA